MSKHRSSRRRFLLGAGAAGAAAIAGCTGLGGAGVGTTSEASSATVFHAGSLSPVFSAAEDRFEADNDADVVREARGSVGSTKKITEQGRAADVLAVSDFRLLRDRLLPQFADWYGVFATNAMAIQYRPDAPGADEIATDNWWEILSRDGVTVAHSDPAVDPGGYRAIMVQQLGATPFEGERLYDEVTYRSLRDNSVTPADTESHLRVSLESGDVDYVVYYRSLCETTDLPWIPLQQAVDLSVANERYASHYATASVETAAGTFVGAPIAYGITVPSVARAPQRGVAWIEQLADRAGQELLSEYGFGPVNPIVVPESAESGVPERLADRTDAAPSIGPLQL